LHTPPFPCAPLFRPPATPTTCTSTPSLHNALPISFRTQKLLGLIQARVDVVDSLYAEFMHFVDVSARPEPAQLAVLNRLLQYGRSEEHTSELQSRENLVCRLLLERKNVRTAVTWQT